MSPWCPVALPLDDEAVTERQVSIDTFPGLRRRECVGSD